MIALTILHEANSEMTKRRPSAKRPIASAKPKSAKTKPRPKGFTSPAWERVYLLSVELGACARELGLRKQDGDGFDLVDASRELARLASNHNRGTTPRDRTQEQESDDWVSIAGLGADLGNMADEVKNFAGIRPIAHELCYLACDYLF
jgi:hypothetical protein